MPLDKGDFIKPGDFAAPRKDAFRVVYSLPRDTIMGELGRRYRYGGDYVSPEKAREHAMEHVGATWGVYDHEGRQVDSSDGLVPA